MEEHKSDINLSWIVKAGLILLVVAIVVHVLIWFIFDFLEKREAKMDVRPSPMFQPNQKPPSPRLQVSPVGDLKEFRYAEQKQLHSYGWVDRDQGIVRIPIEEAMKLMLETEKASTEPPNE